MNDDEQLSGWTVTNGPRIEMRGTLRIGGEHGDAFLAAQPRAELLAALLGDERPIERGPR